VKYEILTAVFYRHTFSTDSGYEGIKTTVTAHAAKCMLQHGLLYKPLRNGFLLLYDTARARDVLLKEKIRLVFDVALKDALFYNYTQVCIESPAGQFFLFSNERQRASAELLHKAAYVTADDLQPVSALSERHLVKPFGQIALLLDEQLLSAYYISFEAKATRWCYFLMSDDLKLLSYPAILSTNGNGHFGQPLAVTLPDNVKAPVFISKTPVPLGGSVPHAFQLVDYAAADAERYKVIIPVLPAPDVSRVSNAGASLYEKGNDYSEIFLY
jgi:hypothetical protein